MAGGKDIYIGEILEGMTEQLQKTAEAIASLEESNKTVVAELKSVAANTSQTITQVNIEEGTDNSIIFPENNLSAPQLSILGTGSKTAFSSFYKFTSGANGMARLKGKATVRMKAGDTGSGPVGLAVKVGDNYYYSELVSISCAKTDVSKEIDVDIAFNVSSADSVEIGIAVNGTIGGGAGSYKYVNGDIEANALRIEYSLANLVSKAFTVQA